MRRPKITLYRIVVLVLSLWLFMGAVVAGGFYEIHRQTQQDCEGRKEGREAVRLLVVVATSGSPGHPVDPANPIVKALTDTLLPGHELAIIKC